MSWPYFALNVLCCHIKSLSMIVLKVYLASIGIRKSKGQPPVLVDLHGPGTRAVSL